jgi:hypothetical protein
MKYVECSVDGCGNPVFSRGLCRKHYEQERLETASPCSFVGCNNKSHRGSLCATHYREHIKLTHPTCTVDGCSNKQKTLKSGLCEKHLFRFSRHGKVEQPRNADWGAREKHPLYQTYYWQKRKADKPMCNEWVSDFWAFVACVGERPDNHTLRVIDSSRQIGPDNWQWKESTSSYNKAEYQKKWRNSNPDKAKSNDLKRMYGITLNEYQAMALSQDYKCAICGEPETAVDAKGMPRYMPVDHCHTSGKVRKLLCSACNKALGGFKDNADILRKAALYIDKYR